MGLGTHVNRPKSLCGDGRVAGLQVLGARAMEPACWVPVQSLSPGCVTLGGPHGCLCLGFLSCGMDIIKMPQSGEGCLNTQGLEEHLASSGATVCVHGYYFIMIIVISTLILRITVIKW